MIALDLLTLLYVTPLAERMHSVNCLPWTSGHDEPPDDYARGSIRNMLLFIEFALANTFLWLVIVGSIGGGGFPTVTDDGYSLVNHGVNTPISEMCFWCLNIHFACCALLLLVAGILYVKLHRSITPKNHMYSVKGYRATFEEAAQVIRKDWGLSALGGIDVILFVAGVGLNLF